MNNYNFTQSLDGLNNIEADNVNTSNLNVGSLIVDTAEITTLSDCNLINCTAETPLNTTSVVNKTYVDTNFVDRTNNLTQNINGLKTFTDDLTAPNIYCNTALYFRDINLGLNKALIFHQADIVYFDTLTVFDNYWKFKCFNIEQVVISQLSSTFNNKLISLAQARFDNFTPSCTVSSPTQINHLTRKDYVDNNFVDKTTAQTVAGIKTFSVFPQTTATTPTLANELIRKDYVDNNFVNLTTSQSIYGGKYFGNRVQLYGGIALEVGTGSSSFAGVVDLNAQATFDNFTPICSVASPTANNHLTRKDYIDTNFMNLTTNQLVGGQKTFLGDMITQNITCTSALYFIDLANALSTNTPQIYMEADIFYFDTNPTYDNEWHFWCAGNPRLTISQYSTEINNPLNVHEDATFSKQATFDNFTPICSVASPTANNHLTRKDYIDNNFLDRTNNLTQNINGFKTFTNDTTFNSQATFNTLCPISSVNPTAGNHLTRRDYVENNFVDKTSTQTIVGNKIFNGNTSYNGTALYCNCAGEFGNLVHLRNFTRVYDMISPFTGYTQLYTSGNNFFIYPVFANSGIHFYCRTSANLEVQTFISSATANTSLVPFIASSTATFNSSLVSNNLTAPTSTSVNNIYTTLVSGGEINIGGSLGVNNIFGQTFFNSASIFNLGCTFLGSLSFNNGGTFSEIEQTSGSNLVIRNYTNSRDIILSTKSASTGQVDSLKINTTSCDILSPTLNLTSSSTINILTPNNLTGVINFLNTLTTATVNFCSTAYTSIFNLNARLAHKQVQYMNEVKIISGTALTLAFPLEQRWQFTSTGATQIVIDLPQLTATHQAGFHFSILKTASNTNSVKFNRQGTNVIRGLNSITDLTTITVISGTSVFGGFLTAELTTGNFAWIFI